MIGPKWALMTSPQRIPPGVHQLGSLRFGALSFGALEVSSTGVGEPRTFIYQPVVVTGLCESDHDWGVAAPREAAEVRLLCGLLSLAGETTWRMKSSPAGLIPPGAMQQISPGAMHEQAHQLVDNYFGDELELLTDDDEEIGMDALIEALGGTGASGHN